MIIEIIALIGLLLSVYAFYVEQKVAKNPNYHAVCDISSKASCTKTFKSPYGHLFGVSNSLAGIGFYAFVIGLSYFGFDKFVFYSAVVSILISLYLAYLLYFKLKNFCLVCNLIYVVNILLLYFSYGIVF